jgi:HAD superfamily hydrolase (TIGR01549 family)
VFDFDKVKGIIFDLDDTLVHANLDFVAIKQAVGCDPEHDILTHIESIPCELARAEAEKTVLHFELADAQTSRLIPGALSFIQRAKQKGIPLAIVTRNCKPATLLKLKQNNIPIETVITRDDAKPKPHPEALLKVADSWQRHSRMNTLDIAYIGDYKYDIEAAHNANMQAWLYTHCSKNKHYEQGLQFIPK